MHTPEPPIEPREPPVFGFCDICGGEIYSGERYYKAHGDCICHWCFDDFKLHEYIAGEEEV